MDTAVRQFVMLRDNGCVARFRSDPLELMRWPIFAALPQPGPCRTIFGSPQGHSMFNLEYHHVKTEGEQAMGMKAPDHPHNGVASCGWHHRGGAGGSQWMTRDDVLQVLRVYAQQATEFALARGYPPYPVLNDVS